MQPKDVQVFPIAAETTLLRSRTWDRLKFEAEYARQRGTTANTYLIRGDRVALLDPPGESFTQIFLSALKERQDPAEIDYIVLGHVNSNRGKTLQALLELAPQATLVCSKPGAIALRTILGDRLPETVAVRGDSCLDLGGHHRLEFVLTPTPRWPGELCTYDSKTHVLYTDKYFGAHVCGDQVFDEGAAIYRADRRYYFDCLMAPHAVQVAANLEKLSKKPAQLYATGHGPLVRYDLSELSSAYRDWTQQQQTRKEAVALLYASAYGNTGTMARAIARGLETAGADVKLVDCEQIDPDAIGAIVANTAGFVIGSPTLGGHLPTQIQTALGIVLSTADKVQLAGVFGSYGWSGEAVDLLAGKIRDAGFSFGFDPIRVKFKPTDEDIARCETVGAEFARALKRRQKQRPARLVSSDSQTARTEQAVGRIVGSMCAVAAKKDNRTELVLVSWVSQSTFDPPGLTVAVSKASGIEEFLHSGDHFALNILPESKRWQKRFAKERSIHGDTLADLEIGTTENGAPLLNGALAYLECRAENRMDCGDHWLIYAVAESGKVLDLQGVTAVHHRNSARA
ncbi:putative flavoprotein [Rubidibacter lacunae KORDI 51-2]|uniref:Putative flavoprotein n=1 Tax=Rubidibacter lacunae KORDI 51-2 TaxID=582515 RepID=U5DQC3_9CHRO|nr:diflavin flavoprotein [Rubidibacter lacunae]ERN41890.1 putative flavoprotein [Rubidibacter lacunae KORDI 51-2]